MSLADDLAIAVAIIEGAARLEPAIADGLKDLIATHRPDLTADAPPENQEQSILEGADVQIKGKFGADK